MNNEHEPDWLTRVRNEQIENFERLMKLCSFLNKVDVDKKVSPTMLFLLRKQKKIMSAYDIILCKRMALADVELYVERETLKICETIKPNEKQEAMEEATEV